MIAEEKPRDIASLFNDSYSRIAPFALGNQHAYLMRTFRKRFNERPNGTALILGPGGQVLPYSCFYENNRLGSTRRKNLSEKVSEGRIILCDYIVAEEHNGLEKQQKVLNRRGFFAPGYFSIGGNFYEGEFVNPSKLPGKSISFLKCNLKGPIPIESNSVSFIDASLSIHHATNTKYRTGVLFKELYRVLEPGGVLHLCEGDVDMGYLEKKILKIGNNVSKALNNDVLLYDCRDKNFGPDRYLFNKSGDARILRPFFGKSCNPHSFLFVYPDARVGIISKSAEKIADGLKSIGYDGLGKNPVNFNLIDPTIPEDLDYITRVNRFYDVLEGKIEGAYYGNPELVLQIMEGIENERKTAIEGQGVENYRPAEVLKPILQKTGFHHEQTIFGYDMVDNETLFTDMKAKGMDPFFNIVARKPNNN